MEKVTIVWSAKYRDSRQNFSSTPTVTDDKKVEYKFKTKAEKEAFLSGVYEASGWLNCIHSGDIIEVYTPKESHEQAEESLKRKYGSKDK